MRSFPRLTELFVPSAVQQEAGGKDGPPRWYDQKKDDPAAEFLKKHGYLQKGGKKLSQAASEPKRGQKPERTAAADAEKPPYKGEFVGQVFRSNSQVEYVPTSWMSRPEPPEEPEKRFGKRARMGTVDLVWTGDDWVPKEEFYRLSQSGKLPPKK